MSLRNRTLTIDRFGAGGWDASGKYVPDGSPTQFDITCSVQPLPGEEMERLPEGRRDQAAYRVFTDTLLRTAKRGSGGHNADQTTIDGEVFECLSVEPWQNSIIPHYEAVFAMKV